MDVSMEKLTGHAYTWGHARTARTLTLGRAPKLFSPCPWISNSKGQKLKPTRYPGLDGAMAVEDGLGGGLGAASGGMRRGEGRDDIGGGGVAGGSAQRDGGGVGGDFFE